jgi:hypothetical protein
MIRLSQDAAAIDANDRVIRTGDMAYLADDFYHHHLTTVVRIWGRGQYVEVEYPNGHREDHEAGAVKLADLVS